MCLANTVHRVVALVWKNVLLLTHLIHVLEIVTIWTLEVRPIVGVTLSSILMIVVTILLVHSISSLVRELATLSSKTSLTTTSS